MARLDPRLRGYTARYAMLCGWSAFICALLAPADLLLSFAATRGWTAALRSLSLADIFPIVGLALGGAVFGLVVAPCLVISLQFRSIKLGAPLVLLVSLILMVMASVVGLLAAFPFNLFTGIGSYLIGAAVAWAVLPRLPTPKPPHEQCEKCGYALSGLKDNRCPECGHTFESPKPHRA